MPESTSDLARPTSTGVLVALQHAVPDMTTDRLSRPEDDFPEANLKRLAALGALAAPLPSDAGGQGWAAEAACTHALGQALQAIGRADIALGRIYEAHVNAIQLIARYGSATLQDEIWAGVRQGDLLGLWVAPSRVPVVARIQGDRLHISGTKPVCTAARFVQRAVITVTDAQGLDRMVVVDAGDFRVEANAITALSAMRASHTSPVHFDLTVSLDRRVGAPCDYLREPDFSAGAWRTSAVTAGALQALVETCLCQLRARARHTAPAQSERIGRLLILSRTATLWADACAERVADVTCPIPMLTAFVNLARVAIETACLDAIPLVQRSLGFESLLTTNPVEAMMRDLALYLRQPAADEALAEAATTFTEALA